MWSSPASLCYPQGPSRGHNRDNPSNPCPWDCTAEQSGASAGLAGSHLPGSWGLLAAWGVLQREVGVGEGKPPKTGYGFPFPRSLKN